MKSSSIHRVSADKGNVLYKIFVRIVYIPLNFINNRNPKKDVDNKLKISKFKIKDIDKQFSKLNPLASPSRKLSNLFWNSLDWNLFEQKIGEFNMLDIGCGSGYYYPKFQEFANNKIQKYCGVDIINNKNWTKLSSENKNVEFKQYNGTNITDKIPKNTNLIVSQSAIEHIIEDINIFEQIASYVKKSKKNIIQIHIFPSAECLPLYLFHGVRQYTPRTISKITKLFSNFSDVELIALGGENSNNIHKKFLITGILRKDIRASKTEQYNKECFDAIKNDFGAKKINNVSFYALIIKTFV